MRELREYSRNSAGELLRDRLISIVPDALADKYVAAHAKRVGTPMDPVPEVVSEPLRRYQVRDAHKQGVFDSAATPEAAFAIAAMFRAQDDVVHVIDTELGMAIEPAPEVEELPPPRAAASDARSS